MRARPAHERYARLPWLIVTMTAVALAIGTTVSQSACLLELIRGALGEKPCLGIA